MNLQEVVLACSSFELPYSFDEWSTLNVSHSSSKLHDADIGLFVCVIDWYPGYSCNPILNLVCDVWHNLYCLSKVISSSLGFNDLHVDFAGCDVVVFREGDVEVSLVVSQVKIDFSSIVEHKHFTMSAQGLVTYLIGISRTTHSVGAIVPASGLRYGSTLIEET